MTFRQRGGARFQVMHVAGQDRFCASDGNHDKVGIDDVAGTRAGQQVPNPWSAIEGDNGHRSQEWCEACLSGTIAPHLGDDGMRRGQWRRVSSKTA